MRTWMTAAIAAAVLAGCFGGAEDRDSAVHHEDVDCAAATVFCGPPVGGNAGDISEYSYQCDIDGFETFADQCVVFDHTVPIHDYPCDPRIAGSLPEGARCVAPD